MNPDGFERAQEGSAKCEGHDIQSGRQNANGTGKMGGLLMTSQFFLM